MLNVICYRDHRSLCGSCFPDPVCERKTQLRGGCAKSLLKGIPFVSGGASRMSEAVRCGCASLLGKGSGGNIVFNRQPWRPISAGAQSPQRLIHNRQSPEQTEFGPGFELKRSEGRCLVHLRCGIEPDQVTSAGRFLEETPTRLSIHVLCMAESVVPFQSRFDPCKGTARTLCRFPRPDRPALFLTFV